MRILLLDPALQEKTQASLGEGSYVVLESDESKQGRKTAESFRKSGGYKLFCDMHKNINICNLDLSPCPPFQGGQSPGGRLHLALLLPLYIRCTARL